MLILGIILTVLGFIIFQWSMNAQSKSFLEKPMIFNSVVAVLAINLLWLGLFAGGFYSLWKVNPVIVLIIFGIFVVLWIFGYFIGSEKTKAKKIFGIYKQLKLFRPKTPNQELLRETARIYYSNLRWDEHKIKITVDTIFEKSIANKENGDIKDVANSILIFESPHDDFGQNFDFEGYMKRHTKKQKAVDNAYNTVFCKIQKVTERPILSKNTVEWIKSVKLNPDEMNNEQLAVFTEIDDHGKSNKAVKFFYYISFILIILTFVNLITLDFVMAFINMIISFTLWFIGNKIQMKRVSKKFYEASIMKYAQQQAENK